MSGPGQRGSRLPRPARRRPGTVSRTRRTWRVGAGLAVVLVLAGFVLVPGPPHLRHSSVLNALFDSRWVIGGTRLVGLAVTLYLLGSIVVRVERDQWLKHVGPADVETEAVQAVADDRAQLQRELAAAIARNQALEAELEQRVVDAEALVQGSDRGDTGPG